MDTKSYKEYIDYLYTFQDLEYKEFHKGLILNSKYELIGIRLPIMRNISKELSKKDILDFLSFSYDKYYEEIMIQGLVISFIKDEELFYKYFMNHIKKIDNWALCDSFCNSIKIVRKHKDKYFKIALDLSCSNEEFISRTGIVMILSHFVLEENLSKIFSMLNSIKSDKFYVNMAEAWLLCDLYIKYPLETRKFLENNNLNKFTQNKAISKIHDSFRVSIEEKEELKKYCK